MRTTTVTTTTTTHHHHHYALFAQNEKGGVLVTDDELAAAFEFFDMDGSGKITMTNLRKRLGVFYKNMVSEGWEGERERMR